jgi:carbon monoxide dehydrogenase subunit G
VQQTGERRLAASREAVWVALSEPGVLRRCLPGCDSVERVSDVEFTIRARVPPAAAEAPSVGTLRLGDVDPPAGFRFTAELRNRTDGVVAAAGRIDLTAAGEATLLRYQLELAGDVLPRGRPKPGSNAAGRLAEAFFLRFERALAERRDAASAPAAPPQAQAQAQAATLATEARPGLRPLVWVPALMLVVALILYTSG